MDMTVQNAQYKKFFERVNDWQKLGNYIDTYKGKKSVEKIIIERRWSTRIKDMLSVVNAQYVQWK